jgi:hypothetical protein
MSNGEHDSVDAETIARRHPAVDAVRRQHGRAVLAKPKPQHRGEPDDGQVVVAYVDYEENKSVVALVDANAGDVVTVEEAPLVFQLSEEEQREAETLAAGDARVVAMLRGRSMNPLTRLYFPRHASPESREHRHAIVFLRPNQRERHYAVIDLFARVVVDVLSRDALTGR